MLTLDTVPFRKAVLRELKVDREATIDLIADWAKTAQLGIPMPLNRRWNDARYVTIAINARHKIRSTPEDRTRRAFSDMRKARNCLGRAARLFERAGTQPPGALADVRTILDQLLGEST